MNKKVTLITLIGCLPVLYSSLPISCFNLICAGIILNQKSNSGKMAGKINHPYKSREHHPRVSFGLFLIVFGGALLVATNDLLNLGSINDYINWKTAMIFVGVLLILNLQFVGGLLLIAGGTWFLLDDIFTELPELVKTVYWPSIIILAGLAFILSSFFKRGSQQ